MRPAEMRCPWMRLGTHRPRRALRRRVLWRAGEDHGRIARKLGARLFSLDGAAEGGNRPRDVLGERISPGSFPITQGKRLSVEREAIARLAFHVAEGERKRLRTLVNRVGIRDVVSELDSVGRDVDRLLRASDVPRALDILRVVCKRPAPTREGDDDGRHNENYGTSDDKMPLPALFRGRRAGGAPAITRRCAPRARGRASARALLITRIHARYSTGLMTSVPM